MPDQPDIREPGQKLYEDWCARVGMPPSWAALGPGEHSAWAELETMFTSVEAERDRFAAHVDREWDVRCAEQRVGREDAEAERDSLQRQLDRLSDPGLPRSAGSSDPPS